MTNSIKKGKNGEREIVNILKEKGLYAKRIGMMETNHNDKGDLEFGDPVQIGQVKVGSHVPKKIYDFLEHEDIAFVRRDRSKWLVLCDIDYFLEHFKH